MVDDYYIMSKEAIENLGGDDMLVRTYKECNPKNVNIPSHDFQQHNFYVQRKRVCPYCSAGSSLVVEVVKDG